MDMNYSDQDYEFYVKSLEDFINQGNLEKAMEMVALLSENLISIDAEVIGVSVQSTPVATPVYNQFPQMNPHNQFVSQNISNNMIKFVPQQTIFKNPNVAPGHFPNSNPAGTTVINFKRQAVNAPNIYQNNPNSFSGQPAPGGQINPHPGVFNGQPTVFIPNNAAGQLYPQPGVFNGQPTIFIPNNQGQNIPNNFNGQQGPIGRINPAPGVFTGQPTIFISSNQKNYSPQINFKK